MKGNKIWIVIIICCVLIAIGNRKSDTDTYKTESNTKSEASEDAKPDSKKKEKKDKKEKKEESSTKGNSTVHIGEEFGNQTITGMVQYVDLDYKDYNELWTKIENGYKAVYIKIKVVNISNKSNYVSVGDFKCYADNISVNAELITGGNDDYNANIEAGRSAILDAMYVVPVETSSIELEYDPFGEKADRQIIIIQDENTTERIIEADTSAMDTESESKDSAKVVNVGEEFGNKTITAVVTDVDLNYKGYDDLWTTVGEGQKAIYLKIKVTNISNDSNYVSVGDYSCYVDDVIVDGELLTGGNDDYNANIDPGRSAILGAMYIIPADAKSIELEYDPIGEAADRVIVKIK